MLLMPLFLKQKRFRRKKRLKCSPDNKHCMTVLRPMLLIRIKKRSLDRKWDSRTDQRMSVFDTNNCGRWNETKPQNEKLSKLLIGQFFLSQKTDEFQLVAKDVQLLSKSDCGCLNLQKPVVKFRKKWILVENSNDREHPNRLFVFFDRLHLLNSSCCKNSDSNE